MTDEHIEKIKSTVEAADHIPAEQKAELLDRLSKIKPTIAKVAQTHEESAQSIARLVEASTHEATRREKGPKLLKTLLRELKQSVEKFEASHPELAAAVSEYSTMLSALGI
jgi:prefoldin subunit 5